MVYFLILPKDSQMQPVKRRENSKNKNKNKNKSKNEEDVTFTNPK